MLDTAIKIVSFPIAVFITLRDMSWRDSAIRTSPLATVTPLKVDEYSEPRAPAPSSRNAIREEENDQAWDYSDFKGQNANGGFRNR